MAAELDKENRKGKGKAVETGHVDDGEGDDDNDDDSEADDEGNDMQLAWEMLELAKLCYSSDMARHRQQLAGEHECQSYVQHRKAALCGLS